ncbi:hypothetical protein H839_09233 [Parageobacillus genomosp. 1]|uniref:Sigma factor regulator N-terminal domain-containing protein n=1 Tax=Parageobacillus genomosp. 1 TaxID=1295642 RepID=A0ABC9VEQ0_9BACL|nr:sigma factor regulator N-terminal domain-containing protein [Parageobacillus genomosp. 1]EZP76767.1 hypothetical protein H839_09233 [Parageobacillus genomosp. 1]
MEEIKSGFKHGLRGALLLCSLLLAVPPLLTMVAAIYYGAGREEGKGNEWIRVMQTAHEMTTPNIYIDCFRFDIFSFR